MKCSNCGFEIPEGHLYCDSCGTEINFVPDFEPEVENEINATLSGVADELNSDESEQDSKKHGDSDTLFSIIKRHWKLVAACAVAAVLLGIGIFIFSSYNNKTALYYLSLSDSAKAAGNMDEAVSYLIQGENEHPGNSDIIFRLSDLYLETGDVESAIESLKIIIDSGKFSDDRVLSAYESIISICGQNGLNDEIAEILGSSDDEIISGLKQKYIPNTPSMYPLGGTYDTVSIALRMLDGTSDGIYYTVNDGIPDADSIRYESEIVLDTEGEYDVKAVSINEYGIASVVAQNTYIIEKGAPAAPEIMEPSGEYNQNTMIVAVAETGCFIFYTTDGSDPTMDSNQYISPIIMPVGTSHFKFVAYNNDGESSEIVERDYHLVYTRLVSKEQAVSNLVNTLVRLDYLLDTTGKVRGVDGHNEYIYNSVIEIQGAGEYYVVIENHVANDGTTAPTGLMYAVNTHDGSVNRLGYDSSGKYTLITISNR